MLFTNTDRTKPHTILEVLNPVRLAFLSFAGLARGTYYAQGDLRPKFNKIHDRRLVDAKLVSLKFVSSEEIPKAVAPEAPPATPIIVVPKVAEASITNVPYDQKPAEYVQPKVFGLGQPNDVVGVDPKMFEENNGSSNDLVHVAPLPAGVLVEAPVAPPVIPAVLEIEKEGWTHTPGFFDRAPETTTPSEVIAPPTAITPSLIPVEPTATTPSLIPVEPTAAEPSLVELVKSSPVDPAIANLVEVYTGAAVSAADITDTEPIVVVDDLPVAPVLEQAAVAAPKQRRQRKLKAVAPARGSNKLEGHDQNSPSTDASAPIPETSRADQGSQALVG